MKTLRNLMILSAVAGLSLSMVGCGDDSESTPGTDGGTDGSTPDSTTPDGDTPDGTTPDSGDPDGGVECTLTKDGREVEDIPNPLTGSLTLTGDKVWRLNGITLVDEGQTLTIEPCAIIEGQPEDQDLGPSVLVIGRGGRIEAAGTANAPILFTTWAEVGERQAGQWGGIIILGRAQTNAPGNNASIEGLPADDDYRFGGTDDADNSGTLTYARIEYAGYLISDGNEVNGLTMGGVGSGTTIHHIMVTHHIDDCFEWFGGTVDAQYLICNDGEDDMFDADLGYRGTVTNAFARRTVSSSNDPNGLEIDGNVSNPAFTPLTSFNIQNATLCGAGTALNATSRGMVLRRGATGSLDEVVVVGWDHAMSLRNAHGTPEDPAFDFSNLLVFGNTEVGDTGGDAAPNDEEAFLTAGTDNEVAETGPFTIANCLADGGPTSAVTGSGRGAFKDSADWMTGLWVDWSKDDVQ